MPEKYHIKTKPVPPRRPRIGKYGVVDWREDCARCHNCVKKACVYDRYRQEAEYIRNLSDVDALFFDCMGCFSCVQDCTKGLLCMSINPEYEKMGNSYWTPDIIKTTWLQAETAKIPVSGAGYRGPFAGRGFDSMWTDMSEIVRPTRDGIHGREYISTSVDIGKKLPYLAFNGVKTPANPLVSIPMPLIIDMASPVAGPDEILGGWMGDNSNDHYKEYYEFYPDGTYFCEDFREPYPFYKEGTWKNDGGGVYTITWVNCSYNASHMEANRFAVISKYCLSGDMLNEMEEPRYNYVRYNSDIPTPAPYVKPGSPTPQATEVPTDTPALNNSTEIPTTDVSVATPPFEAVGQLTGTGDPLAQRVTSIQVTIRMTASGSPLELSMLKVAVTAGDMYNDSVFVPDDNGYQWVRERLQDNKLGTGEIVKLNLKVAPTDSIWSGDRISVVIQPPRGASLMVWGTVPAKIEPTMELT